MKKRRLCFLFLAMLGTSACTTTEQKEAPEGIETENKTDQEMEKDDKNHDKTEAKEDKGNTSTTEFVKILVYYPNDNADGTETEEKTCDKLTAENVWNFLKEKAVVSEDTFVNSLEEKERTLKLDVNEAFGNQLRSYGTSGESMLIESVVNTYLDAYNCEKILITENGETLASGHMEYTEYMEKFE